MIDDDVYLLLFPHEKTAVEKLKEKMPKDSPLMMGLGVKTTTTTTTEAIQTTTTTNDYFLGLKCKT